MLSTLDISVYTSLFNPLTDFEVGIIGNCFACKEIKIQKGKVNSSKSKSMQDTQQELETRSFSL